MILASIIIGLIIILLICLINFIRSRSGLGDMDCGLFFGAIITILFCAEVSIVSNIIEEPKPTPMDVYQGKTTIEYTIRDGVKIDSVVVFKDNVYGK